MATWSWSSSPYADGADTAWNVNFDIGNDGDEYKSNVLHVRLVRGGQALPFDRIGVWRPSTRQFLWAATGITPGTGQRAAIP